jgi:SH3-like domain-containing protein
VKSLLIACAAVLVSAGLAVAAPRTPPKVRPYTGIGVMLVSIDDAQSDPLYLYDEPSLSRRDRLNLNAIPPYEWIFGSGSTTLPIIVSARKGNWVRVVYDDAGREAWLNPARKIAYHSWNSFFKLHVSRLLPGLQNKFYQLYQLPEKNILATLAPTQSFKVLRIDNDWAQVMLDQYTIGWLRWRDEDGRLLIGILTALQAVQP